MRLAESEILNASILIVDDQEANVSLLDQLLHKVGYVSVSSTMNPSCLRSLRTVAAGESVTWLIRRSIDCPAGRLPMPDRVRPQRPLRPRAGQR